MMGAPYLPGFGRCGIPRTSTLDCARSEERWASGSVDSREADDRQPWIPTSAKTGQIWGTHHSLTTEITPLATIGFLGVLEKFRLKPKPNKNAKLRHFQSRQGLKLPKQWERRGWSQRRPLTQLCLAT